MTVLMLLMAYADGVRSPKELSVPGWLMVLGAVVWDFIAVYVVLSP